MEPKKSTMQREVVSIQFLRFVAATLVVFGHSVVPLLKHFSNVNGNNLKYLTGFGGSGVHVFFVISGFVMIYSSFSNSRGEFNSGSFLVKRFIRIFPIYWVYALIYILFDHVNEEASSSQILGAFLLLPGYSSVIIGPGWTLAFEIYFYLCFAVFMTFGLVRGLISMTFFFVFSIGGGLALGSQFLNKNYAIFVFTNSLLLEFLAGAWIAFFVLGGLRIKPAVCWVLLTASLMAFGVGIFVGYHKAPSVIMWGLPSALLVSSLVFMEKNNAKLLFRKIAFLGDSSYSLYLLHVLIVDIAVNFLGEFYSGGTLAEVIVFSILVVCFSIVVSLVFYELIERRLVDSLRHVMRRLSVDRRTAVRDDVV